VNKNCCVCGVRAPILRIQRNAEPPIPVCEKCAETWLSHHTQSRNHPHFHTSILSFFLSLAHLRPRSAIINYQPSTINYQLSCPSCRLTYAEFSEIGLTGCDNCYNVFEAAILPALIQLCEPTT